MKSIIKNTFGRIVMSLALVCMSLLAFAQDKKIEVDINTKGDSGGFQMQTWMWVVLGGIFILILAAVLRPRSKGE